MTAVCTTTTALPLSSHHVLLRVNSPLLPVQKQTVSSPSIWSSIFCNLSSLFTLHSSLITHHSSLLTIMTASRQERLRKALESDLINLPDKPQSPQTSVKAVPQSPQMISPVASTGQEQKVPLGNNDEGVQSDSEDSEADCYMEMAPIIEEDKEPTHSIDEDDASSSTCSDAMPSVPIASTATPQTRLVRGQLSSLGESFCPIIAVSKFPYKYIAKTDSERVADKFFNAGQFWMRKWDL